jgi:hypothetical protein
VLAHEIDPELVREGSEADLDHDGTIDQVIQTDTSLQVILSTGGGFSYSVSEMAEDSATGLSDWRLLSLNQDGRYPSIILATERDPPGVRPALVHQQLILNDSGRLSLKTFGDYPLNARAVDCAWVESNDLPVCFYASFGPDMGRSKLIEVDPQGLRRMATDSAYLNFRNQVSALYDGWVEPGHPSARDHVAAARNVDLETVDSILAMGWAAASRSFVDSVRAIVFGLTDRYQMYSTDLTREYRLPWPVELSRAYDQRRHPQGRWMDGYMMVEATFLDFSGDGLLDLVAVGQHSGVFSAVQHSEGYFVDVGYHGLADEYHEVRAPRVRENPKLTVPPCVLYSMEQDEASRSDYIDCYDRGANEWYEVTLPEGPYWTEYEPVHFQDINADGMIDFVTRRDDGTWVAFTFVSEEGTGAPASAPSG